jgi:lysophospholipase L1-like esterase
MNPFLAFAASVALIGVGAPSPAAEYIQYRGGCPLSFRKFIDSQTTKAYTKITFFGGSASEGLGASKPDLGFRSLLMRQLRQQFPGATLAENNSAIGGTGAWLGAFRTQTDALYGGAALVFVEFAVDAPGASEAEESAAVEGIVRQILARDWTTDIVFLYALDRGQIGAYRQGRLPDRVAWHERIAEHYGIPSVDMGRFVADKIAASELTLDAACKDGLLTTDRGHALYMEAIRPLLDRCKTAAQEPGKPVPHKMPKPLCGNSPRPLGEGQGVRATSVSPRPLGEGQGVRASAALSLPAMDHARCVPYDWARLDAGWNVGCQSSVDRFMHVLQCDRPGAVLTLRFKGSQVGCYDLLGPDSGDLEFSIDGGAWKLRPNFDPACCTAPRPHGLPLATGLDAAEWHELRLRVAEKQPAGSQGRTARIGWLLVDGEVEDPHAKPDPLARLDAIYAAMDPLDYAPPADRWQNLDRTIQRLRDGGALRIVMLGDSIIGDTSSSKYDLLLQRMYPKCKIEKITSVRGSTGCWWYKDGHVDEYVLRHKPDLLMIGGISQREDIDSIREVIHQVRAKQSPEILLMTPAFGATSDPHIRTWTFAIAPDGTDYRARLRRLAIEERCGFVDMTGPWWRYVQQSGKCYGWFQRDRVHANERGFQILGHILEKFFAPEK